jgi:two-component system response regulator HydG
LVAATNKNLAGMVKAETFREDLYFRLRVVEIRMPPLRERPEDIPLLAHAFLKEFARENSKTVSQFTPEAMDLLMHYQWPGNVRELRTSVERAVVLCRGDKIGARDLPPSVRNPAQAAAPGTLTGQQTPGAKQFSVKMAEKDLIIQALKESNGNRTRAAQRLGLSRRTLHRKLKAYQLENL